MDTQKPVLKRQAIPHSSPGSCHRFSLAALCAGVTLCSLFAGAHATAAPAAVPSASPAPAFALVAGEAPFDFSQGIVVLDVDIGGSRPARLVLDVGNLTTVLDLDAARELGIPLRDSDQKTVGTGAQAVSYYRFAPPKFKMGTMEFSGALAITPVRKNFQAYGVICDGTLGYGILKDRVVQVDYPGRHVRFLDASGTKAAAEHGQTFAITWKKYWSGSPNLVTVDELQIGGHRVCAQVDTFYAATAVLFPTKLPWLKPEPAAGAKPTRYEDSDAAAVLVPDGLALGNCRLDGNTAVYIAGAGARVPETELSIVLGTAFFRRQVLTFDFPASQLILEEKASNT